MSLFRRNKGVREERDGALGGAPGLAAPADGPTVEQTAVASGVREPAELDALVGDAPSTRRRGRLRRRLRHLRRVREVLLRDLGGLTFELHRTGGGQGGPALEGKLARLSLVDREIRDLEHHLSDHRAMIVREPGIGGTCAACGELFGSEARYCWACGNPVAAGAGAAPQLAPWSVQPQLAATSVQPVAVAAAPVTGWPVPAEHPTAPLPQMDPSTVAALGEQPAPNEPATGDVGGDGGAIWSAHAVEGSAVEEHAPVEHYPAAEQVAAEHDAEVPAEHDARAPEPAFAPEPVAAPAPAAEPTAAPEPAAPEPEPAAAAPEPEPAPAAAAAGDWLPRPDETMAPHLSSGDPLASPPRPGQS